MRKSQQKIFETKWNDNEVEKYFIKENGTINSIKANDQCLNFYTPLKKYLYERFSDIEEGDSPTEIVYRIVHKLEKHPKCPLCGKRTPFKTYKLGYSLYCSQKCALSEEGKKLMVEQYKKNCLEKYGVDNTAKLNSSKEKTKETNIKKYGVEHHTRSEIYKEHYLKNNGVTSPMLLPGVKEKVFQTNIKKYGGITPFVSKETQEKSYNTKRIRGTFSTSKPEEDLYQILLDMYSNVIRQYKSKEYPFKCDFYLPDYNVYIELNGSHFHNSCPYNDYKWQQEELQYLKEHAEKIRLEKNTNNDNQYDCMISIWSERDVVKRQIAKSNHIRFIELYYVPSEEKLKNVIQYVCDNNCSFQVFDEHLFDCNKQDIIDYCLSSPFPGSKKWAPDNPIWDCNIPGKISPKEAWHNIAYIERAVSNLFYILNFSISNLKYEKFVKNIMKAFNEFSKNKRSEALLMAVLDRFTIAKIAPKVTALSKSSMLNIIIKTNYDLSTGVYCPMAGFGGIVEASKQWFIDNNLDYTNKIESYDINELFVNYYNFTGVRDILKQKVKTNKTVIVCPPFGTAYEHWKGTPDEMSDKSFLDWYKLIKEYIEAPQYIIIGPELNSEKNSKGLFGKRHGIQLWDDELYNKMLEKTEKERATYGLKF